MSPEDIMATASHYSEVDAQGYVRFCEDDLVNFAKALLARAASPQSGEKGDEPFRTAVEEMVALLENGEWAEHVAESIANGDDLASRLETAITELHNDIGTVREALAAVPQAANEVEQYVLSILPSVYYMDPPDGGDVSVLEQLRRLADDAAKYRAGTSSDAAITACALMIKGICMTCPSEEWASKIEARIRFMLTNTGANHADR